jgi:hypothetical protein
VVIFAYTSHSLATSCFCYILTTYYYYYYYYYFYISTITYYYYYYYTAKAFDSVGNHVQYAAWRSEDGGSGEHRLLADGTGLGGIICYSNASLAEDT